LLYKAGDLMGDMKTNYKKARTLFVKLKKMRGVSRKYRGIAKKHASDIKSTLIRLKDAGKTNAPAPKKKKSGKK
jgi:hypothetical protein